jgi:hypothetical protein
MVFVSYSHLNKDWLNRFRTVFKPLSRYAEIDLWSDERIKPGENWRDEINEAMDEAVVAVLLVSIDFLNSDFVANKELPYILAAAQKRKLKVLWIKLTPCLVGVTPLRHIQAAAGIPKPLNAMTDYEWMTAFCKVCGEIDVIIKKMEMPVINPKLNSRTVKREERKLQVLGKPAMRETEVLVYSGDGWHTQSRVAKGAMTADCWFGDLKHSKPGDSFKIIALTTEEGRLNPGSKHLNIPKHRTKSAEATVKRA